VDGVCPTWRQFWHSFTPVMGFPPLWGWQAILRCWDVPPLGESCLYTLRLDVPQYESVNADIEVHPSIRPDDGIFPPRRLPIKPRGWDVPHTKAVPTSVHFDDGIFPHSKVDMRFSVAWMCLHSEDHVYTLLDGMCPPCGSVSTVISLQFCTFISHFPTDL